MVQSLPKNDAFRILFNSPELSEVQRSGFHLFLKKGIAEELSKISCIQLKDAQFLIEVVIDAQNFRLVTPENSYRDCILKMKSYTCKLYVETKIFFKDKLSGELLYQTPPEWVLLADLPIMTKRGHFVINGSPRVIVHQVGRAPGVYFKKIVKVRTDVNNKARFYGDIIPRKGVWVRLQMNKKGEIEFKLKKSKKVRAEMVQKCLELLEKERVATSFLQERDLVTEQDRGILHLTRDTSKSILVSDYQFKFGSQKQSQYLQDRLHTLKENQIAQTVQKQSLSPSFLREKPFDECPPDLQTVPAKASSTFTQRQPFLTFSVQTLSLTGIHTDEYLCSKTRQTQAFVITSTTNKVTSVVHPIWYRAMPWFMVVKEGTTEFVQKFCKSEAYKKSFAIHSKQKLLSNDYSKTKVFRVGETIKKYSLQRKEHLVNTFDWVERSNNFVEDRLYDISSNLNSQIDNVHSALGLKETTFSFADHSALPLGSKMYGNKRSDFTKAEREAFTNVYTSFYKNEIQDIKERVSTSFGGKKLKDSSKQSVSKTLFSATKPLTQPKTRSLKNLSKTRMTKKQNLSNNLEKIREYLYQLFKRSETYDLGAVGREKINTKFGTSVMGTQLTSLDIKETINWLSKLREGKEEIDDIDHSQNRRVRTSSELIQTQLEVGITRLKSLVTKKVHVSTKNKVFCITKFLQNTGRVEHTKALPFTRQPRKLKKQSVYLPDIDTQNVNKNLFDGQVNHSKLRVRHVRTKTSFLYKRSFCINLYRNINLSRHRSKNQGSTPFSTKSLSLPKFEKRSIKVVGSIQSDFKGGTACFVKRNVCINKIRLDRQKRTTFTSINPYYITHSKKERYYSTLSKSKDSHQKLQLHTSFVNEALFLREQLSQEQSFETGFDAFTRAPFKTKLIQEPIGTKNNVLCTDKLISPPNAKNTAFHTKTKQYKQIRTGVYLQRGAHFVRNEFVHHVLDIKNVQLSNFSASDLFSTKPINGALREFFSSSPLSQYMDQTNPLADITHKRRMSSLGAGGVSRESAGMAIRGIHPTHYGRICPIETPEGKNAGLVNSLAFYARINNQGFIETPYYQVTKGQIQHELGFSFYSAEQESTNSLYIAPNDIKQSKSKLLASNLSTVQSIPVRVADTVLDLFKKVTPYQVSCIGVSPVQILSVATSLIPFLEHNDANRALMGSNMQRQAVSLMISERPIVGTGLEARVLAESGHLIQSKVSGFISSVSAHRIVVERLLHNLAPTLYKNSVLGRTNAHTKTLQKVNVRTYSFAKAFAIHSIYSLSKSHAKALSLQKRTEHKKESVKMRGHSLPVTVLLETDNHQAPLPISSFSALGIAKQWLVKKRAVSKGKVPMHSYLNKFRSEPNTGMTKSSVPETNKYHTFAFQTKKFALLPVTHPINTFTRSNQETCMIQKPLVEEGDWIQKGDMLSDCSAGQKGELSVGRNVFIAYIPWQGYNFEDAIVISDRLVKEQLYTSLHIERYTIVVNDFKDKVVDTNEWFTGNLPGVDSKKRNHLQKSGLPIIGTILREGDILAGKIRYSKKKPATPHERLVCDILGEHNFSVQNSSLYVPKGVHEARVLSYKVKKRFEKGLKNDLRPAGAPKVVHIFLGEKRNLQVGDKMSGRHGNKGIVSTVLPKQDMPYLADGSPIDILLNPLGVPSRMNVGQVFECLLGLASTYLHQNFKITAFDELYGVEASQSLVFLKLYQARLQSGQNWLFQVNFPGKTRLTDGRSGECLDQWVTVGRAYMLKLIHMVNEKIHARAIGPYALVTQQPLKGRAHKGGQRLGEMEVWAVEGFGAAYILQELLTKKSDDSIGRKEVLKAMLPRSASLLDSVDPFGQSIQLESSSNTDNNLHTDNETLNVLGQPDIFKVLICELQALCLDVGVYSMRTESFQRAFLGVLE